LTVRPQSRARGFTLIELLVGTAVSSVVLLAISYTFISQARQYQSHVSRQGIQSNARKAISVLERSLRQAGYGVDPDRAIIPYDSFNAATNQQEVGFPDAIAIHLRDPLFVRHVTAAAPNQLTLDVGLQEPLPKGQILLVLCPGARVYTYVTLLAPANKDDTILQMDTTDALADSPMGPPGALFRDEERLDTGVADNQCFAGVGSQQATVVKVDRLAFYVASFDDDGDGPGAATRPYLMMHRGLDISGDTGTPDNFIDARDAVPVAEGIEQLQLAYLLNTIHSGNPAVERALPLIVGMDNSNIPSSTGPKAWPFGERWATEATADDAPEYADPYDHQRRTTAHPANIRQVRLTLVSRSNQPDPAIAGDDARHPGQLWTQGTYDGAPAWSELENLGEVPSPLFDPRGGGFYRAVLRQSITPKNLLSRSQFLPTTPGGG
jgi:type IV pilus assembly protein PilW